MGVMSQTAGAICIIVAATGILPTAWETYDRNINHADEVAAAASLRGAETTLLTADEPGIDLVGSLRAIEPGVHWTIGPVAAAPNVSVIRMGDSYGLATRSNDTCLYRVVSPHEMSVRAGRAELTAMSACQAVDAFSRAV